MKLVEKLRRETVALRAPWRFLSWLVLSHYETDKANKQRVAKLILSLIYEGDCDYSETRSDAT